MPQNSTRYLMRFAPFWVPLAYVVILATLLAPFIASSFVVEDDTFYLPRAILGEPLIPDTLQANFYAIAGLGRFGSFELYKVVLLTLFALNSALLAVFLARVWGYPLLASLVAMVVMGMPVAVDQYIFFTGAHPTFAMTFILLALHVFQRAYALQRLRFVVGMMAVSVLLWVATQVSPTETLALFLLPLWLFIARLTVPKKPTKALFWASAIGALCVALAVAVLTAASLQYNDLGWVNVSALQILQNFVVALVKLVFTFGNRQSPLFLLFWAGISLIFALCVWQSVRARNSRPMLSVAGYALATSALTFGPSSILITFASADRYLVLPVVFGMLALIALGMSIAPIWEKRPQVYLIAILALLVGINLAGAHRNMNNKYAHIKHTHDLILAFSQQERGWL
mgnify:CR=1 FL=1